MIATWAEYSARFDELTRRRDAQLAAVAATYQPQWKALYAWYQVALKDPNSSKAAVDEEFERRAKPIRTRESADTETVFAAWRAAVEALDVEARPNLVHTFRTIIASSELTAEAVALRGQDNRPAPHDNALLFVTTFDDLHRELAPDRAWDLLSILVPAEDGAIRLDGELATLSDLAARWRGAVQLRVPEVVTFLGPLTGAEPDGAREFGDLVGVSEVIQRWTRADGGPPSASIDAPARTARAEPVTLTARGAAAPGATYTWTFSRTGRRKRGRSVTIVLLDDITVTLTVRDRDGTATARRDIVVTPRPWRTGVDHAAARAWKGPFDLDLGTLWFGANRCALHGDDPGFLVGDDPRNAHLIHRKAGVTNWRDMYTLARVNDPGGPDHQRWYVASCDLRVHRLGLINTEVYDGRSATAQANRRGPDATALTRRSYADLRTSVIAHETEHSLAMFDELVIDDPAVAVEALTSTARRTLDDAVNSAIAQAEDRLDQATNDHKALAARMRKKGWGRKGRVLVPRSGRFVAYPIRSYATLGDAATP